MPIESVQFTYNGTDTVVATVANSQIGTDYTLICHDPASSASTDSGNGGDLVLTVNTIGGISGGDTFYVQVQQFPDGFPTYGATIFELGTEDEFAFDASWSFDGIDTVSATFTAPIVSDSYIVDIQDSGGGGSNSDTGTGTPQIITAVAAAPCVDDYFYVLLYDPDTPQFRPLSVRLFTAGLAGEGFLGNPIEGPAPPAAIRMHGNPLWRFIVTSPSSRTISVLDQRATDKTVAFALNQPAVHSGTVAADDDEINRPFPDADSFPNLHPNVRLIYGFRYEGPQGTDPWPWICRFGGIVLTVEDQGTDAPVSSYSAYDPWQYLFSRPCLNDVGEPDELTYTNQRGSDIALDLISKTILTNGTVHLDITNGELHDTPVVPGPGLDFVIERGVSVGEALQRLCATGTMDIVMSPVYDPINRPGIVCELNIYVFAGDRQDSAIMAWDKGRRSITAISRLIDGTQLANKVQMFAGQGGDPVDLVVDSDSVDTYGEYWSQQFLTAGRGQAALVALFAQAQALIRRDGLRSITFDPAPERAPMVLRDYGLGDYLPVWASRNLRQPIAPDYDFAEYDPGYAGYLRVYAIPITIRDDGVEQVQRILTSQDANG